MVGILFFNNSKINNIEEIKNGNPGIGGSEYLVLQLFYYLYKIDPTKFRLITSDNNLKGKDVIHINDSTEIVDNLVENNIDKLIFIPKDLGNDFYENLNLNKIKCIAWVHNYINYKLIDTLKNNECIKKVVFVGKQHYECYIDDELIKKSTYIYNMVNYVETEYVNPEKKENIVTYVGSLVKAKGFHRLAKVWKKVIKKVPDAKLYVVGSGKLYDSKSELGSYNIASLKYEKKFIKYLINKDGKIIDSVKFLGLLGNEKHEVLMNTKVGVANPTGISETFCLSAVEYKQYGIPVVTYNGYGLLDTVYNRIDGLLIKSDKQLTKAIVNLLNDNKLNKQLGKNGYKKGYQKFLPENIINNWVDLIENIDNSVTVKLPNDNYFDDFKYIKIINYKIKKIFNLKTKSLSYTISYLKEKMKKIIRR